MTAARASPWRSWTWDRDSKRTSADLTPPETARYPQGCRPSSYTHPSRAAPAPPRCESIHSLLSAPAPAPGYRLGLGHDEWADGPDGRPPRPLRAGRRQRRPTRRDCPDRPSPKGLADRPGRAGALDQPLNGLLSQPLNRPLTRPLTRPLNRPLDRPLTRPLNRLL